VSVERQIGDSRVHAYRQVLAFWQSRWDEFNIWGVRILPELNWHYLERGPLDFVAVFWLLLPAVELNTFDMCDHLAVRLSKVSIVAIKKYFQSALAHLD
jgi:hypothetical protein